MFRPGRENRTRPNQKTSIVVVGWQTLQQPPAEAAIMCLLPTTLAACDDQRIGGRIQVCLISVSQGWGSLQRTIRSSAFIGVHPRLKSFFAPKAAQKNRTADERR